MAYTYECDDCGDAYDDLPAFMGELREAWFKTSELGGLLAEAGYAPGQTVTFCPRCIYETLVEAS